MFIKTPALVAFVVLAFIAVATGAAFALSALGLAWYVAPVALAAYALGRFAR